MCHIGGGAPHSCRRALRGSASAPFLHSGGFDRLNHRHFRTACAAAPIPTAQEVRLIKTAACLPSQLAKARTLAPTAQSLPHRRCPIYRSLFSNDCSPAASSASVGSHSYFSRMIATLFMTSPPVASRAA